MTEPATTEERKEPRRVSKFLAQLPVEADGQLIERSDKSETPRRISTTMREWGQRMPIGILDSDGRLHKDIAIKKWKTKDDRELGRKIAPDATMTEHVPLVVANMCSRIGPHNMDELDDTRKTVVLSTMYMADVFYIYILLRMHTMGSRLSLNVDCPRIGCGVSFPYTGDLNSIDVVAVEDIDAIIWRYNLEDPIELRHKPVTHLQMAYPKWGLMEHAKNNQNETEIKALALQGAIVGLNDETVPVALSLVEIDELSKPDFEGMQEGINQNFLGPKMGLEGSCQPEVCTKFKRGGHAFNLPIDWKYRNFFGASSR
jgi:hypothetical protein